MRTKAEEIYFDIRNPIPDNTEYPPPFTTSQHTIGMPDNWLRSLFFSNADNERDVRTSRTLASVRARNVHRKQMDTSPPSSDVQHDPFITGRNRMDATFDEIWRIRGIPAPHVVPFHGKSPVPSKTNAPIRPCQGKPFEIEEINALALQLKEKSERRGLFTPEAAVVEVFKGGLYADVRDISSMYGVHMFTKGYVYLPPEMVFEWFSVGAHREDTYIGIIKRIPRYNRYFKLMNVEEAMEVVANIDFSYHGIKLLENDIKQCQNRFAFMKVDEKLSEYMRKYNANSINGYVDLIWAFTKVQEMVPVMTEYARAVTESE